jgi:hypothetical protein
MRTLKVYKFLVAPVLQQLDETGTVVGELQPPNPDAVFGVDGLARYAARFEAKLAEQVAQLNGAGELPALEPEAKPDKEVTR